MALLKVDTANNGPWNLPSVKDLLNAVDSPRRPSASTGASTETACQSCLGQDRRGLPIDGKSCPHYAAERVTSMNYSASQTYEFESSNVCDVYQTDLNYVSRRSSVAEYPQIDSQHVLQPERYSHSPPFVFNTSPSSLNLPQSRTPRYPYPGYTGPRPRLNGSTRSTLTPAKIASNDRHKLSEKHRRDGMGAFVQAGDILRKGINPGLLTSCPICQADAAQNSPRTSPTGSPLAYPSIPNSMSGSNNARPKKPKNNMLEEGLMWEFNWLLHIVPAEVSRHLEGIRDVAAQMARDKEYGMRNDVGKRKKWDSDVRSEVLGQVLGLMERESEKHGVDPWIRKDEPKVKRKRVEDSDGGSSHVSILTPPSSRTSPSFEGMLLRDSSVDCDNDTRQFY